MRSIFKRLGIALVLLAAILPVAAQQVTVSGGAGLRLPSPIIGYMTGLQPLKLTGSVMAVNPGSWANAAGTKVYTSGTNVLTLDMQTNVVDFSVTPATGGQVSGAVTASNSTTDGVESLLYLIHRNSDNKVALVSSSANTVGTNQTVTITIPGGVFTTPLAHGLMLYQTVFFSTTGALPTPMASNFPYYVCTTPSTTTFTIATTIANAVGGTCLPTSGTQSGTHTMTSGVQYELDNQLGAGVATVDRRIPYLNYMWCVACYGPSSGIPNFTVPQGGTHLVLTSADTSAGYRALNAGTATSFTAVSLKKWLGDLDRQVTFMAVCNSPATLGGCFVQTTSSGGTGFQVGAPAVVSVPTVGQYEFITDGDRNISYMVTGGAQLSIYVTGWDAMDPS